MDCSDHGTFTVQTGSHCRCAIGVCPMPCIPSFILPSILVVPSQSGIQGIWGDVQWLLWHSRRPPPGLLITRITGVYITHGFIEQFDILSEEAHMTRGGAVMPVFPQRSVLRRWLSQDVTAGCRNAGFFPKLVCWPITYDSLSLLADDTV